MLELNKIYQGDCLVPDLSNIQQENCGNSLTRMQLTKVASEECKESKLRNGYNADKLETSKVFEPNNSYDFPISILESFNILKKEFITLNNFKTDTNQEEYDKRDDIEKLINNFKDLQKEIENKTYGCGRSYCSSCGFSYCDESISCGTGGMTILSEGKWITDYFLCPNCKAEKEEDEKILKQIKEILK